MADLEEQMADAAERGDVKALRQLVMDGGDVNYADQDSYVSLVSTLSYDVIYHKLKL